MATTTDESTDAQATDIDAPFQVRAQQTAKRALAAPFRATAALVVKAYELNETAGVMAYNGVQFLGMLVFSNLWPFLGESLLRAGIDVLYEEGDKITQRRFNAYTLLTYGAAFVTTVLAALYLDAKFQQHFAEQRQEQVMTDITDSLDTAFDDTEADDDE